MSNSINGHTSQPVLLGRRPRGPDDNKERAYIAAAKRKDRSRAGKIESAKKSSEAHYETHGRFFYLTEENILAPGAFEELEEEEQVLDPELILPDGITRQFALEDLRAKAATNGLTTMPPAWVNGGSTNLRVDYPVFRTAPGEDLMEVYPTTVSLTDLTLHSTVALNSSSEELNFGLYLKDPDEIIGTEVGGDSVHPEHDEPLTSQPSYREEIADTENGLVDYVLDLEGLGDSDYQFNSWTKDQRTE